MSEISQPRTKARPDRGEDKETELLSVDFI